MLLLDSSRVCRHVNTSVLHFQYNINYINNTVIERKVDTFVNFIFVCDENLPMEQWQPSLALSRNSFY